MLLSLFLAGFLAASSPPLPEDRLWLLYEKRDFFSLRQNLPTPAPTDSVQLQFLRAQTDAAFGQYQDSNRILLGMLHTGVSDAALERAVRERLMLNERALFHYRAALSAITPIVPDENLRNRTKLLAVLQGVPPEVSGVSAGSVTVHVDRFGAVQAFVNNSALHLGLDTGANLSVLSRSAADKARLPVKPAGYRVRLANGRAVAADIAVARLRLGNTIELSNIVFVVLPDSALRTGGGQMLDGLIGLPELSQLGDIQFGADGVIALNAAHDPKITEPIALIEGDPVVQVMLGAERILCRIDTGSNRTMFYGPLRKRMPTVLTLATRRIRLHPASMRSANQPYVKCSLGRDALRQIEPYTLDFHNMQLGVH